MNVQFIATVSGPERSGIMSKLAKQTHDLGGIWLDSKLNHLDGQFIGLIKIELPTDNAERLKAAFAEQADLCAQFNDVKEVGIDRTLLTMSFQSNDREGLVHDISNVLTDCNVDVDHMDAHRIGIADLGRSLFTSTFILRVPANIDLATLEKRLAEIEEHAVVHFS